MVLGLNIATLDLDLDGGVATATIASSRTTFPSNVSALSPGKADSHIWPRRKSVTQYGLRESIDRGRGRISVDGLRKGCTMFR